MFSWYLSVYKCLFFTVYSLYMCVYLKGSHAELDTEAQVNIEVVWQKIEDHVVSPEQRDEEEGGLGEAPVAQKERNKMMQEVTLPQGVFQCMSNLNAAPDSSTHAGMLIIRCQSRGCLCVCASGFCL